MSNTERVVAFLNKHSVGTAPTVRGVDSEGRLLVACDLCNPEGVWSEVVETIKPDMSAARLWLGY